jgi:uncharacterized membrane protein YidH (DUF202 family)
MLGNFLIAFGIIALIGILYRSIKSNPDAFSAQNLNKSFLTMGVLALILICVMIFVVALLR